MAQKAWRLGLRLLLEEPVSPPTMRAGVGEPPELLHALSGTERLLGVSPSMRVHADSCTLTHSRSRSTQGSGVRPPRDTAAHTRLTRGRDEDTISGRGLSAEAGRQPPTPLVAAGAMGTPAGREEARPGRQEPGLGAGRGSWAPATSTTSSALHTHGHGQNGSKRGTAPPRGLRSADPTAAGGKGPQQGAGLRGTRRAGHRWETSPVTCVHS